MTSKLTSGIEIHQQLDIGAKLFCKCPIEMRSNEDKTHQIVRFLNPTKSEMGKIDQAAAKEGVLKRKFIYNAYPSTCLVEEDDEPPHRINMEALKVAIEIGRMLNMKLVDEVHVMRKIVVDGSNTAGFQRTALIGTDGYIELDGKRYGITVLCLEEEACQKVEERKGEVVFSLDRLGIPLVEIGTAPDIESPGEAREVAAYLGMILRSTGKVKRGIGTIRQDLNISIPGGARVEIKGVQYLQEIENIIELEIERRPPQGWVEVPPVAQLEGVDLVTEGRITLGRCRERLGAARDARDLPRTEDGATRLARTLLAATWPTSFTTKRIG